MPARLMTSGDSSIDAGAKDHDQQCLGVHATIGIAKVYPMRNSTNRSPSCMRTARRSNSRFIFVNEFLRSTSGRSYRSFEELVSIGLCRIWR